MLTGQVVDYSDRIFALLNRKLLAAIDRVSFELADDYKAGLQANDAPPHSDPGQIPHRYLGHKPNGYGPVFGENEINNRPEVGFSAVQADYLSSYIEGGSSQLFDTIEGFIGFAPSHVTRREQNYLIEYDQRQDEQRRPWVKEIYTQSKPDLIDYAIESFRSAD